MRFNCSLPFLSPSKSNVAWHFVSVSRSTSNQLKVNSRKHIFFFLWQFFVCCFGVLRTELFQVNFFKFFFEKRSGNQIKYNKNLTFHRIEQEIAGLSNVVFLMNVQKRLQNERLFDPFGLANCPFFVRDYDINGAKWKAQFIHWWLYNSKR